jgi:hypothetical protein
MKNEEIIDMDNSNGEVNTTPESKLINEAEWVFQLAEWVFQFDDAEPQIFAVTPEDRVGEPLSITLAINNSIESNIVFTNGESKFSIYSREITDKGREFRESQQLGNLDETQN